MIRKEDDIGICLHVSREWGRIFFYMESTITVFPHNINNMVSFSCQNSEIHFLMSKKNYLGACAPSP